MHPNHRRFWSFILLGIFLAYATPRDLIHLLAMHHDTKHEHSHQHDLQIDPEHHHCEILKLEQHFSVAVIPSGETDFQRLPEFFISNTLTELNSRLLHASAYSLPERGPPAFA
ncbi:MAG: hypothetical protein JNJ58_07730 [Chitinophagaceae bacterium]|nr:hypothetical protein [Chitinophagaceae bacterium]